MNLPVNWKLLNSKKLFYDYQRPAYKDGDMGTVKLIGQEMARRLRIKGLQKVKPFGWMPEERIISGLNDGIIVERKDGSFAPVVKSIPVLTKLGRKTGSFKPYYGKFGRWLEG